MKVNNFKSGLIFGSLILAVVLVAVFVMAATIDVEPTTDFTTGTYKASAAISTVTFGLTEASETLDFVIVTVVDESTGLASVDFASLAVYVEEGTTGGYQAGVDIIAGSAQTTVSVGGTTTITTGTASLAGGKTFYVVATLHATTLTNGHQFSVDVATDGIVTSGTAETTVALDGGATAIATIDTVAPTAPSAVIGIVSDNALDTSLAKSGDTVTVTATVDAGTTVTGTIGGKATTTNVVSSTTATLTRLLDGTETEGAGLDFTLVSTDAAGNSAAGITKTQITDASAVETDFSAPTAAVISMVATDDIINAAEQTATVTVSGTNEDGATVTLDGSAVVADTSTTWSYVLDAEAITAFGEGAQTLTAVSVDAAGNSNAEDTTRDITVDTVAPVATLSCTPDPVVQHAVVTCTCSGTDIGGSGINSALTTAATTPSTAATGTYTVTTCSVTDNAGNSATATDTYLVSGASSGSSSGGSYSTSFWTKGTHAVAKEQFALGFTKQLSVKQRIKVQVGSANHHVGVTGLTATAATINISSDPQQAVLSIGDERKFEVSGDNYYDIFVKLNSIENNKADVTIKSINELISEESVTAEIMKEEEAIAAEEPVVETIEEKSSSLLWWILTIVIVIVIILVLVFGRANKKVEKKKK